MSPHFNDHVTRLASDRRTTTPAPQPDIIGALLQALNGSNDYRIMDVCGELFLEPQALCLPPVRGGQAGV